MRTFGTYIVELLVANGVELVFGIPGAHTIELYRGLQNTGLRHVTSRHEQGAGFMADGYARVSGKPGVCFVISGPGVTNIATAMGQAYCDSIPLLVISAVNPLGAMGSGAGYLHELPDQRQLMRQVSAFSHTVLTMDEFELALARAFAIFGSARPRPVHIEIPTTLLRCDSTSLGGARRFDPPARPGIGKEIAAAAAELLENAGRPVIVAGGGARRASVSIRSLAEALHAPVLMTVNGRGILSYAHELAVPIIPASSPAFELLSKSDVVLAIGTEMGPTDFGDKLFDLTSFSGKLVRIDIDPEQAVRGMPPDLAIVADAAEAVEQISALIACCGAGGRGKGRAAAARAAVAALATPMEQAGLYLLSALRDSAPSTIIVGDSTQPVYAGCMAFGADAPGTFFCSATGYGTLGYALPAAIGAKIAAPDRSVVCVIGDGGLQFTLAEMATATEIGCPVIMIVWNNNGYGQIKTHMENAGIKPVGVDIFTPDFRKLAQAFDWHAEILVGLENLGACLAAVRGCSKPSLIEIVETS
ncbi:5-guanidino-2-oxopentanoate decarboxylase [Rhizobium jaguaris]|uniref:5-guanidino-2-oxopentanoate decarboxylase n=1 Tax=Rhizobium jaguaris TaxID=1312183 RepID=A0A387FYJ0_9HYPH|nr:5-guanidino-2-oxopentanoate decarboxylase [Rhizobium jaguaris]AYG64130.1 5-guanidino-2-oxopentanoate decarboxylase [Rhizobium jaguaris]